MEKKKEPIDFRPKQLGKTHYLWGDINAYSFCIGKQYNLTTARVSLGRLEA